jgi:hypothetical protein
MRPRGVWEIASDIAAFCDALRGTLGSRERRGWKVDARSVAPSGVWPSRRLGALTCKYRLRSDLNVETPRGEPRGASPNREDDPNLKKNHRRQKIGVPRRPLCYRHIRRHNREGAPRSCFVQASPRLHPLHLLIRHSAWH